MVEIHQGRGPWLGKRYWGPLTAVVIEAVYLGITWRIIQILASGFFKSLTGFMGFTLEVL